MNASKKEVYYIDVVTIVSIIGSVLTITSAIISLLQIYDFPFSGSNEILPRINVVLYYICNIVFVSLLFIIPCIILAAICEWHPKIQKKTLYFIDDKEVSKTTYLNHLKCNNLSTVDAIL